MTDGEAIEILKNLSTCIGWTECHCECYDNEFCPFGLDVTVENALNAYDSAIESLEKQTPKTPTYKMVYGKRLLTEAYCPECGNTVFRDYGYCSECGNTVFRSDDYCSKCGQAIDWSEVENGKET